MRRAIIPALLLVLLSVVLGATVFREQVAQAAATLLVREQNTDSQGNIKVHEQGTANVNLTNSSLPVREQNIDAQGNTKVHEQGTANVNVTNSSLSIAPASPITGGGGARSVNVGEVLSLDPPVTATELSIFLESAVGGLELLYQQDLVAFFLGPALATGHSNIDLALTRPIRFDKARCSGTSPSGTCFFTWIGAQP
jgi:hypothetical protein